MRLRDFAYSAGLHIIILLVDHGGFDPQAALLLQLKLDSRERLSDTYLVWQERTLRRVR